MYTHTPRTYTHLCRSYFQLENSCDGTSHIIQLSKTHSSTFTILSYILYTDMTEAGVVVNGEPHIPLPATLFSHSTEQTDMDDLPRADEVAVVRTWNKPQISIEQADADEVGPDELVSSPTASYDVRLGELEDSGSTDRDPAILCLEQARVYPKTPPPSYKFRSPQLKENENMDEKEGTCMVDERARNGNSESSSSDFLRVSSFPSTSRSHSLPAGIKLEVKRMSTNSDETVDSELGSPPEKRKLMRHLDPLMHGGRLDSAGSNLTSPETSDDSSSDGAGEEEKMALDIPTAAGLEQEDEIFLDSELSEMQEQADTKLVNWACNDFVPACHQLLSRCCQSEKSAQVKSANVQADLRSLSNTITFFCTEQQQRLSQVFQQRPVKTKGSGPSTSTQTFPRPQKGMLEQGTEDEGVDRSYAVKVLRSASQSLIAPLLVEASQREGFTPNLHQAIIKALQKIAWKVEACVSFSNPSHSVEIHAKIFDEQHVASVRELMIQALPPAEPNLRIVQPPLKQRKCSLPNVSAEPPVVPMRRGQSVKEKIGADPPLLVDLVLPELQSIGEQDCDDNVWKEEEEMIEERHNEEEETALQEHDGTPHESEDVISDVGRNSPVTKDRSCETTPNVPRRERIATEGEADILTKSPLSRRSQFGGSIPNLDREEGSQDTLNESGSSARSDKYFRPKAFRRTTVSLSRKEVQTLGLTVAKRVDETILDEILVQREQKQALRRSSRQNHRGSKSEEKPSHQGKEGGRSPGQLLELKAHETHPEDYGIADPADLEKVGERLHNTLTQSFNRYRSVSMSDIIDCEEDSLPDVSSTPDPSSSDRDSGAFSPQPNQRLELVPQERRPLVRNASANATITAATSSQPVSPSYVPSRRSVPIPPSHSSDWVVMEPEKHQKKLSVRVRAKATVKKSLSSSGKLAHRLLKTSLSLRNGPMGKEKMAKSLSAADLLDESSAVHSQQSTAAQARMSMSIGPGTTSYDVATLPSRGKRKNTIARFIRRGKDSRSRSFGKSDKYSSGSYSSWHQGESTDDRVLTESIESVSRNAIHSMAFEGKSLLITCTHNGSYCVQFVCVCNDVSIHI